MKTIRLTENELYTIRDSLADLRLSVARDVDKNPELVEYLKIIDKLDSKLAKAS